MSRRYALLMTGLFVLVAAPIQAGPAAASCAGPSLDGIDGLVLHRGATASIEGSHFTDGCRDTMSCTGVGGCQRCEYTEPPVKPMQDVVLELRQDGRTWRLATADAGTAEQEQSGKVTWTFELPRGADPGRAKLVASSAEPIVVRLR